MKLQTLEDLQSLKIGDLVWTTENMITIPKCLTYLGIFNLNTRFQNAMIFTDGYIVVSINLDSKILGNNLQSNCLFTTEKECYQDLRKRLLHQIDHYNRHQLKEFPIKVE